VPAHTLSSLIDQGFIMKNRTIDFFRPPEYERIEQTQKARFLHIALLVITGTCFMLGFQNMPGNTNLDIFLFTVGCISFLCIPLNKRGYYAPVALFIDGLLLAIITFSLIAGVGLWDAGLIAYPIFIIFSSYLLNKKSVFYATLLSIGSVVLVYYLDKLGYRNSLAVYSEESQLMVILVLFPAAGLLLWVVVDNWERIMKDLRDTYDLTLSGWGQALEYRDRETEGHSQRVVDMTIALAVRLGIPKRKLDYIRRGALLHDIGKMAIPDAILLKKGGLSEDEWKVVRMHPLHAKKLMENIPYLKMAQEIPYYHHERWDGSGYPEGLSKEDIPFSARLFAVVDVWDALTSDRPYREAWPVGKVRDYIRDQSGKLFDPRVVEAFLELIESDKK
jgi:HD-GYP domain-containing protein (c-di-GMP phosphodiesterase class II)